MSKELRKLVPCTVQGNMGVYNPGEVAGFGPEFAAKAIRTGALVLLPADEQRTEDTEYRPWTLSDLNAEALGEEAAAVPEAEPDLRTHSLTVEQVAELVSSIEDLDELQALWVGELAHPQHDGEGRKGALAAIRAQADEVKESQNAGDNEATD